MEKYIYKYISLPQNVESFFQNISEVIRYSKIYFKYELSIC